MLMCSSFCIHKSLDKGLINHNTGNQKKFEQEVFLIMRVCGEDILSMTAGNVIRRSLLNVSGPVS